MDLTVTIEYRFDVTPDGCVWTEAQFANSFWRRYLAVFDRVHIVARGRSIDEPPANWLRVDDDQVQFHALPYYIGPLQYLRKARQVRAAVRRAFDHRQAVIFRLGSQIANCMEPQLRRLGKPFAIEAVTDPWMIFAPGANRHPLRRVFRSTFSRSMRRQCQVACAVAYVTKSALQSRYPAAADAYSTHCSDVELSDEAFVDKPRTVVGNPVRLVSVGSMSQPYKAFDVLIDSVGRCIQRGCDLQLTIIGDGKYRSELESQAQAAGCDQRVHFVGQLPAGKAVREQLDQADLFVLPSRVEGLPRAMIEAMARGLPCIGTRVGGIPELLADENLVPPDDMYALAAKLQEVSNPARMRQMSIDNLGRASNYHEDILQKPRVEFYQAVRDATAQWLKSRNDQVSSPS